MQCGVDEHLLRELYFCVHMRVFHTGYSCRRDLTSLGVDTTPEDVVNKLALVQKAPGRLVRALKTMSAWKGD